MSSTALSYNNNIEAPNITLGYLNIPDTTDLNNMPQHSSANKFDALTDVIKDKKIGVSSLTEMMRHD